MRARWAVTLAVALGMVFAGVGSAASATDPVELGSSYVLDDVGALSAPEKATVHERLVELYESHGVDLYVAVVSEFTNPANSQEWADEVAKQNGLGTTQYVLAIATDSRQYYISADSSGPLSDEQLDAIEAEIKPILTEGDIAGAVIAVADGFDANLGGGAAAGAGQGGGGFAVILVILAIAAVALIVWLVVRNRRKRAGIASGTGAPSLPGEPADTVVPLEQLAQQAASALVETDDAVKTSEQELGFAKAQFGDAATVEFEQALTQAKNNLNEAFTLKQQLDDGQEDSEGDTRAWNTRILELCTHANAGLDEKAEAFDELRKLEQNAPEAFAQVQEARAKATGAAEAAAKNLETLATRYAPDALATVADNPEQAAQRLAFADEQLAVAEKAIGAGQGGEAAIGIRAAEEAVAQATLLQQAVDKLGSDLAEGEKAAAALVAELETDIATASALPDSDGRVAAAIAATRQQIDATRADLAGTQRRPLSVLESLKAVNTQIDAVVQGARDAHAQSQRTQQMLGQTIMQAQAQVSAAEDFITSRRGAIGAEARTRLAQAGASLVQAQQLQATNPDQAMQHAQRANELAGQAIQYAQNDVGSFQGGGMGDIFGGLTGGSGGSGRDSGGGMLGAVLGGILINSVLGGGGSRSGGGLGGMFGGGGGRISPGSFGGGGTRGRRGGGRF